MSDQAELMDKVQALLDALTFDDSGFQGKGGNGGLISRETIRKADEVRIAMSRLKQAERRP